VHRWFDRARTIHVGAASRGIAMNIAVSRANLKSLNTRIRSVRVMNSAILEEISRTRTPLRGMRPVSKYHAPA
jgi:hypothetical protein